MGCDDDGKCSCLQYIFEVKIECSQEMAELMADRSAAGVCGVDGEKLLKCVKRNCGEKTGNHLIPRRVRGHNLLRVAV